MGEKTISVTEKVMADEYSVSKSFITALASSRHQQSQPHKSKKNRHSRYIHTNYADIFPGL